MESGTDPDGQPEPGSQNKPLTKDLRLPMHFLRMRIILIRGSSLREYIYVITGLLQARNYDPDTE